jgi:hypothetical protein
MENLEFKASHGWFQSFKTCTNLHSLHTTGKRASTDIAAAMKFSKEVMTIIKGGGHSPKHILNVYETGLFWKRMPSRTIMSREEKKAPGFSA